VRRGDTLDALAFQLYRDAGLWRPIARANGLRDVRTLAPGTVLLIPRLTGKETTP
jgi:nucleoid-associated protein YgaU